MGGLWITVQKIISYFYIIFSMPQIFHGHQVCHPVAKQPWDGKDGGIIYYTSNSTKKHPFWKLKMQFFQRTRFSHGMIGKNIYNNESVTLSCCEKAFPPPELIRKTPEKILFLKSSTNFYKSYIVECIFLSSSLQLCC